MIRPSSFVPVARIRKVLVFIAALIVGSMSIGYASPPSPELVERMKLEGRLQEMVERLASARAKGVFAPGTSFESKESLQSRALSADPATVDTFRVLVILIDFDDRPASDGPVSASVADFEQLLFSFNDYDNHYSMSEFFLDNSYGGFYLEGLVAGWYRMPETNAYYCDGQNGFGPYPTNAQNMAEDAVLAADPDVDFSQFDNDGNGWVDGIFIVHSGPGAEQTGSGNDIWSHAWSMSTTFNFDGVFVRSYTAEPEEDFGSGLTTMGVYCHEYGHFIGLPDLYDTDYSSSGVGDWSLMSGGSWNLGGAYPAFLDAWCKKEVGFLTLTNVTSNMNDIELPASVFNPVAYRLWQNGTVGPQYFIIENRQKLGNELGLDGSGLLIMHIDETVGGNANENHPLVAIEQADGLFHLEGGINSGDLNDVWSTSTKAEFNDLTTPNTRAYGFSQTKTAVWNISESDSVMTASFEINFSRPLFQLQSFVFSDAAFGNGNGLPEEGETITFEFTINNQWAEATNTIGTLSSDNNDIVFGIPSVNIGTVAGEGGTGSNTGNLLEFSIPIGFAACIDSFYLELTSDNSAEPTILGMELQIGTPSLLLVDDDDGDSFESYYSAALSALRVPFDVHNISVSGTPSGALLSGYETVVWMIGNDRPDVLSSSDISSLTSFMDGGGNLFLSGQSIAAQLDVADQSFLNNYLRSSYVQTKLVPLQYGLPGSPIGDGIEISFYAGMNQTTPDVISPLNGSVGDLESSSSEITAISYAGVNNLVFFSFGFEAINSDVAWRASRDTVMARVLSFFSAGGSINPLITDVGLESEASASNVVSHNPEFYWSSTDSTANPVIQYEVKVGTGNLCYSHDNYWAPSVFTGSDTSVTYAGAPLEDGQDYLFQVRVFNGTSWSSWSKMPFHMNSAPVAGFVVDPKGDQQVLTGTPDLRVREATDDDEDDLTYEFELYSDLAMTSLVTSATGVAPGFNIVTWTVDVALTEDQQYFWISRAYDSYEHSEYTPVVSFYVNAVNLPPAAFSLISPADDDTVFVDFPQLIWQSSSDTDPSDVVFYTLQSSLDPTFSTFVEDDYLTDTVATLGYAVVTDTAYYWKVKAFDLTGDETWSSETFHFNTPRTTCCTGIRGNADNDAGDNVFLLDLLFIVDYLFREGPEPVCMDEADANGSGEGFPDIIDIVFLAAYLFMGGPAPPSCL